MFHPLRVSEVERLTDDCGGRHLRGPARTARRPTATPPASTSPCAAGRRRRRSAVRTRSAPRPPISRRTRCCGWASGWSRAARSRRTPSRNWRSGDVVEVMAPAGPVRPGAAPRATSPRIVGGSGITPVLSIAATLLAREPDARFCLIRSDRTAASTMFLEEVADLKDRYPDASSWCHALSREEQQAGPALRPAGRGAADRPAARAAAGRLRWTAGSCAAPTAWSRAPSGPCAAWACPAPGSTRRSSTWTTAPRPPPPPRPRPPRTAPSTATLDGRSGNWPVQAGESLLETVLRNRADAPYACKGGVCGTCRAFLVAGEVRMDRNFALEPEEIGRRLRAGLPVASGHARGGAGLRPLRRLGPPGRRPHPSSRGPRQTPHPATHSLLAIPIPRTCSILTLRQDRGAAREDRTVDFTFTEEQQAAAEAARAVFSGVAPDGVPSPALTPGAVAEDFDRTLWRSSPTRIC